MEHFLSSLLTLVSLSLAGNGAAQEVIRVGGTGTGTLLIQTLIPAYVKLRPNVQVNAINPPLGSNGALRALGAGAIQVAIVSIPSSFPPEPKDAGTTMNIPWTRTPFIFTGRDVVAGTKMTISQVAGIYSGSVTQWPGGVPIRLVARTDRESDTRIMRAVSAEMNAALTKASKRLGMPFAENDYNNQSLLEKTAGSFGGVALGQLRLSNSPLNPVTLDGIAPSAQNLLARQYPIEKPLYLIVSKASSTTTLDFVKYLQSPEVMKILGRYEFISKQR